MVWDVMVDFDGGKSILRAIERGMGLKINTLWALERQGAKRVSFGPQVFRVHPFQWPEKWICPDQNH
jgi:hypothetical protein